MSTITDEPRFLTLSEACQAIGLSRPTLRSRINAGELVVYDDPLDRRRVLVTARDLKTLSEPRPRPRTVPQVAA